MNRQRNVPFNTSAAAAAAAAAAKGAAPVGLFNQQQAGRTPQDFRECMIHMPMKPPNSDIRISDMAAKTRSAHRRAGQSSAGRWKSSFKPVDGELSEDDSSQDKSTNSSERIELYDPYDPGSSDSESDMTRRGSNHDHSPPDQDNNLARQRLSPGRGCLEIRHWNSSFSEPGSRPLDRHDFNPGTRPSESRGLSQGHRLPERRAYSPGTESLDRPGYGSINRPLDHRSRSPDRNIHSSSTQQFPGSYRGHRTNGEERITMPEYKREMGTTVRSSPPRSELGYQHQLGHMGTGLDQITPSKEATKNRSKSIIIDNPISCDLCDVEFANGQELEDHLDSKSHWDTLEHIQQHNNYDDMAIAFLQEVMLYKSRQCSRAIEDTAFQALQENDHMTKVEMFHCASCQVFISTSVSSVQSHITSQEHLSNTKEFGVQQRRACLEKAETMMTELKPQLEHFLKGGSPFV
ncbi:A-kinase anchor protein 8-like isoform X2 [Scomber scombrus]|uniref:A-kinase anchor protein 8-like isoform X2 n=1 Tax=Scomber scombrus TaxID=13677 RepID=UPI002DD9D52F|nr:A-kinase anchor protein 8-like isoform X2 [Scomber scombrus]